MLVTQIIMQLEHLNYFLFSHIVKLLIDVAFIKSYSNKI